MTAMDETARAKDLEEQVARARQLEELSHEPVEGWPGSLEASSGLTPYELGLLHSQMMGHRWHAWRRLNGGGEDHEDYFVACSCGWRSLQANSLAPVLGQVKDHLEGVRVSRGGQSVTLGSAGTSPGSARARPGSARARPGSARHAASRARTRTARLRPGPARTPVPGPGAFH